MSCCYSTTSFWNELCITLGWKKDDDELEGKEIITSTTSAAPALHETPDELDPKHTEKDTKKRKRIKQPKRLFRRRTKSIDVKSDTATTATLTTDIDPLEENDHLLEKQFPTSTPMERKRFLKGRSLKRAAQKMELYTTWRENYHLNSASYADQPNFEKDVDTWNFAVAHTSKYYVVRGSEKVFKGPKALPRIIKFGEIQDLLAGDGRRIAIVLPGLIDKTLAPLDFYARCVGVYLDLKFDRNSNESIYVIVDVRQGQNWPNESPSTLLPFVKSLNQQLIDAMPERMLRTVVFPIPTIAKPIWALFKGFIDKKVVAKIDILWGGAAVKSPIPKGMKNKVFNDIFIKNLEGLRKAEFKDDQ